MRKMFCFVMVCFTTINLAFSQDVKQKMINVSGSADMELIPDEIYVQVTLKEYDKKGSGKVDIDNIKKNFLRAAISVGIPDSNISVQSYQGWDENYWWYRKNKKQNPDMLASITYQVKLGSTKKMDELVEKLDDEATQSFSIQRVDHSRMEDFKKALKIQAVKAAREKAEYLAEAIGEHVGEALIINDPNEINRYPQPMYAARMAKMDMQSENSEQVPNVDFKKLKLQFEVNVAFALK